MDWLQQAPTLVLRAPPGPAVLHLILRVPPRRGREAAALLGRAVTPAFGAAAGAALQCSVGISFAGLEALGLPARYLRLLRRLAPAFAAGAVQRSAGLGDTGASAPSRWRSGFAPDRAHLVLTWHGPRQDARDAAQALFCDWEALADGGPLHDCVAGEQLGAPPGQIGQWVHFGYRDGVSEVALDGLPPAGTAPDTRRHRPGALLLGHVNDAGFNPFALTTAPAKVRAFFASGSFGVLRPMRQDLAAFERAVDGWWEQLRGALGASQGELPRDFAKAKLCGRWPEGRVLLPGALTPSGPFTPDFDNDPHGEGCPFGAHVRRMRAAPGRHGLVFDRPLQRRSVPFGPAAWNAKPADGIERGLVGHFFCASIEQQFEHLLGQWAVRPPLGAAPDDTAADPLLGPHDGGSAALRVPLAGRTVQHLAGFRDWVTTLGTLYAWYPSRDAWQALLAGDYVPEEDNGPWL